MMLVFVFDSARFAMWLSDASSLARFLFALGCASLVAERWRVRAERRGGRTAHR
jgi:hypothetical protein